MPHLGFEPTLLYGVPIFLEGSDRLRPRLNSRGGTQPAKAGSKLSCTRHGGVFLKPSRALKIKMAPLEYLLQRRQLFLKLMLLIY